MKAKFTIGRPIAVWLFLLCLASGSFFTACTDDEFIEPTSIINPSSAVGDAVSITNAGFENDKTGWSDESDLAISSSDVNSGSKAAKISSSSQQFEQTVSVSSNTNYTLSAYVLDKGTIGAIVGGSTYDDGGDYDDFTKVSVTFNSGSNTSITIFGAYNGGEGRFDDFELIEGSSTSSEGERFAEMVGKIVRIENVDSDLWLRVTANNADQAEVELTTQASTGSWPRWEVEELLDGGEYYYRFRNVASDRRLRPNGSGVTNMEVGTTSSTGSWTQWSISSDGNGGYVLKNRAFGTYINASDNTNTTVVSTSSNESGDLTTWRIEDLDGDDANGESTSSNNYTEVPALIQAEDYDDATEGRTEDTGDTGGGENVGWIDSGEYLSYNVNVPSSGTYTMDFRVAASSSDIEFDIYQGSSKIGSISESATGGWQTYTTVSTNVSLSSGDQTIKIQATGGGWNINWLEVKEEDNENSSGDSVEDILGTTWKITVPYDANGNDSGNVSDPDDRNRDAEDYFDLIEASEDYPSNFYVDGDEVIFKAHCGGATTTGSIYPRTELRQLDNNGDDEYFDMDDYQHLDVTVRVLQVPVERPEVNMVQIHGPSYEPIRVEYNAGSEGVHLTVNEEDGEWEDIIDYDLEDRLRVRITVDGGHLWLQLNNLDNGDSYSIDYDVDDDTGYFKVGCYLQSSITYCEEKDKDEDECTDDQPDAVGIVAVSDLTLVTTW